MCLEEIRCRVWRICLRPPSGSKNSCKWNATKVVCWTVSWAPRTNQKHSHRTDGVVKAAGFRRMNEENRWNVDSWNALRGLSRDVTERGADAAEAIQASTSSNCSCALGATLAPSSADLGKCGARTGCAACSDIAVHGKTAKPHTEECRTRFGEQMDHHLEGHERLQVHKRRRDVSREPGASRERS